MPPTGEKGLAVIVCGDRYWDDWEVLFDRLNEINTPPRIRVLIEGGARGADTMAGEWADRHPVGQITHERFPADWERYGRAAGPIRNGEMLKRLQELEEKYDIRVIAFHHDLQRSKGTKNMVDAAMAAGVEVMVLS